MKWWKRVIFSVISIILGYCSLDYLFYAFQLLANIRNQSGKYHPREDGVQQLLGAGLFFLWFVVIAFYFYLISKSSNQIDLIESDKKTGKERIKRKWFDKVLQIAFLLTGMLLRWGYLIFIYFPNS